MNLDRISTAQRWSGIAALLLAGLLCISAVTVAADSADDNPASAEGDRENTSIDAAAADDSGAAADDDIVLETQDCVRLVMIDHTRIIDDSTILFYMHGPTIYLNKLPHRCAGLRMAGTFAYDTRTSELCNVDLITVVRSFGGRLDRGVSCGLGKFQPITEEQVQLIKEHGAGDF